MKNNLFFTILFCFFVSDVYAQKESNNWYFGEYSGIAFPSGVPMALYNSAMYSWNGCSTISDTTGNLLFYTNGEVVYNRNHQQMPNGSGLLGGNGTQNCIIVPYPGNQKKYYIFTVGIEESIPPYPCVGLYYSIINMALDGGRGDIEPFFKNMALSSSDKATYKITAVRHQNNTDVWVIVRNLSAPDNEYHSYLITPAGINTIPVRSPCLTYVNATSSGGGRGQMKVSPDGKLIFASIYGLPGNEIGSFNASTGEINIWFTFYPNIINSEICGVEFSQDTRFLYLSTYYTSIYSRLIQYDVSLLPDESSFLSSMKIIAEPAGVARDLQMGPDGKIYVARYNKEYLGVINNPGEEGIACGYDTLGVYLGGRKSRNGLPQFIQSYFLRFSFEGNCAGEPIQFTPNFNPVPDSIHWDFGDPGSGANNTTNELNPAHTYLQSGIYTATAFVRYPDGRTETATREVTVTALPEPYPLSDTVICKGTTVTLQAEGGYDSYLWSTNQNTDFITVADTGYYWVEAVNTEGCIGRDTVHVGWHPLPQLTTDTIISPTTCGNNIGAITGVNIISGTPPYSIEWLNSLGNIVGTTNDLYNLGVDNYYLWVTDGNGCRNLVASCAIQNFNSDLIIRKVTPTPSWCNQPKGKLEVEVQAGLSDRLLYTIDNWTTHQTTGVFDNLVPNPYNVKVRDSLNCEAVYAVNPVIISSQPGVEITGHNEQPEIDNLANGSITIFAIGDSVTYSLNGQLPAQTSNVFENLVQGQYTIDVRDKHGCDSTLYITILPQTGQTLFATAGDTMVCNGLRASEPLMVSNFKDITSFEVVISYNDVLVEATGVNNIHSELVSGLEPVNYPSAGVVRINWNGSDPVTLPDNTVLFDLVVQGKAPGLSTINWLVADNQTRFINHFGVEVPVKDSMGNVTIAPNPEIWGFYEEKVCEFSKLSQMAIPSGGTGTLAVIWDTPKGTFTGALYEVPSAGEEDSGLYSVKVIDQMNCIDNDTVQVTVVSNPQANLPSEGDTLFYSPPFQLMASPGYFMYVWNTGENANFINVTEDGEYTLIIKTEEGCADTSSVVMINGSVIIQVPNAFTPNGDGLNDTFKPIITRPDMVVQYHLSIYNRWGQRFFETSDPAEGWDGKDELPGIYNWVLSYSNQMGKRYQMKGVVTLIK